MKTRCPWVSDDPLYINYHDKEWGRPVHDDQTLFEFLILEGAQAGLSWLTVLKKRENYRRIFHQFDVAKVAAMSDADLATALTDPGIIRNKLKVASARRNALAALKLIEAHGSLDNYFWHWTDGETLVADPRPEVLGDYHATTPLSDQISKDLKKRGMLDDTLVIWGGEFGRTAYSQGTLTKTNYGRDHHPRCFTMWMAGGGIKGGVTHGQTDEFGYNIVKDGVHIHDLHATMLHLLGIDHERLTYKYQGRHFRLTDVHGHVVKKILA